MAQSFEDGLKKIEFAKETEQRLYPTFTHEIFTKTVNTYHDAGNLFYQLLTDQNTNQIRNSYYGLYSWLQEANCSRLKIKAETFVIYM